MACCSRRRWLSCRRRRRRRRHSPGPSVFGDQSGDDSLRAAGTAWFAPAVPHAHKRRCSRTGADPGTGARTASSVGCSSSSSSTSSTSTVRSGLTTAWPPPCPTLWRRLGGRPAATASCAVVWSCKRRSWRPGTCWSSLSQAATPATWTCSALLGMCCCASGCTRLAARCVPPAGDSWTAVWSGKTAP